jgi:hypothetical protein
MNDTEPASDQATFNDELALHHRGIWVARFADEPVYELKPYGSQMV